MSSTRTILIFLGFIFLIIVIISSGKIAGALRDRLGKIIPGFTLSSGVKLTPTVTPTKSSAPTVTPTPTSQAKYQSNAKSSVSGEIPATGPESFSYILISASLLGGIYLKRFAKRSNLK